MNTTFKSQEDFIMKQKSRLKKPLAVMLSLMLIISAFTALPVTASAATAESAAGAKSGKTGDCTWSLDDNGTLTISGNGAMKDYYSTESLPWGNTIEKVIIKNGVTAIGNYTFDGCALKNVYIPDSVTWIGEQACGFLFASYVVEGFTEYANNNPTAKKYANDNGFKFVGPDVKLGDVNGDGVVNGSDAGILARYVSGWKQYDKYFNK